MNKENFPKCVIVGAGWIGSKLADYLPNTILFNDRIETIGDFDKLIELSPEIIINAGGKTGRPNVDWCEDHKPETYLGNVHLPYILAEGCKKYNLRLVHLASGCIYQGDNNGYGWSEDDKPNFEGSYYSHTKAVSERLLSAYDNILICRLRMPFDSGPSNRDLLTKLLGYDKIISYPNSISIMDDLLKNIQDLIIGGHSGIFNCVNSGAIDAKEILEIYEKESGQKLNKEYVPIEELNIKAPRSNCVMNTDKLKNIGLEMPEVSSTIVGVIKKYIQNKNK